MQNAYMLSARETPQLMLDRDVDGNPQTDPNNPLLYKTKLIDEPSVTAIQSLGVILEF